MKIASIIAGLLLVLAACAHLYLGERYILRRLFRRADLPHLYGSDLFTRRTIRFAWHVTSVAWLGFAAVLFASAGPNHLSSTGAIIAATFVICALYGIVQTRGRHLAWPVFLAIAIGAAVGAGR